jgi:hypothetical protein
MDVIGDNKNNPNLNGGAEDDNISGLGGNDTLRGFRGADNLNGGSGKDELYGEARQFCRRLLAWVEQLGRCCYARHWYLLQR